MKICFAVLYYSPERLPEEPVAYLDRVPLFRHLPRELAAQGHSVHLVHQFSRDARLAEGGVDYRFVAESRAARGLSRLTHLGTRRPRMYWEPAGRSIAAIRDLEPDLIHFHGTVLHLNLALLLRRLGPNRPPLVVHHHGGEPARNRWLRRLQARSLGRA